MEAASSGTLTETSLDARGDSPNPFAVRPRSSLSTRDPHAQEDSHADGPRYYRSRLLTKDENRKPPTIKKHPGEKWLWIIPLTGLLLGVGIAALMVYMSVGPTSYNYCPVLDEDFSSGTLDPKVWTAEIEAGGFGNGQFDMTTDDPANLFVQDGQLHIKPTLQNASLIATDHVVNLTASGTCTSALVSNCVTSTNTTNGTIVQPVLSARINTKAGATIQYGRVEVEMKVPQGDWLWPALWMLPVNETYGPWPASGEIDIMEGRGNNHTYPANGNDIVTSTLHWGPSPAYDAFYRTTWTHSALHAEFGAGFHTFGLEWSAKYIFTYIDTTLLQVFYFDFDARFWPRGDFPTANANGTALVDPWSQTGRDATPFDQRFYLILNVGVGGTNGWFPDGAGGKPWVDQTPTAKKDFWGAREQWFPTWAAHGEMVVNRVKMWQQC